jgi:deoxyribonuclease-4
MSAMLRFGPAGMPLNCKGKRLAEGILYAFNEGLGAFEVEFVRGVRIRKEDAIEAGKTAKGKNVLLSCHGPYWVNCCSPLKAKQQTTIRNIMQTARAAELLGAKIIVFHPGYYQKQSKEAAFENALNLLKEIEKKMKDENLSCFLGLETSGKKAGFGTLDEIIGLCKKIKKARPVIDFAHLHAITNGGIRTKGDYEEIISKIKKELGPEYLKEMHCHFTEIVYSDRGERYHIPIGHSNSPPFRPLAEILAEKKYKFTIISESPLLDMDALKMQGIVQKLG